MCKKKAKKGIYFLYQIELIILNYMSFLAYLIAVGGKSYFRDGKVGSYVHGKAEVYTEGKWFDIEDHPVGSTQTYASTYHEGKFYYFGGVGQTGDPQNGIACLNSSSWTWSWAGKLQNNRYAHSVIVVGNQFLVVGGYISNTNRLSTFVNTEGLSE